MSRFDDEVDRFDIKEAKRVMKNIDILTDLHKLKVKQPGAYMEKKISLRTWEELYYKKVEYMGVNSLEAEVPQVIGAIVAHVAKIGDRVKEAFRRQQAVIIRQKMRIRKHKEDNKYLKSRVGILGLTGIKAEEKLSKILLAHPEIREEVEKQQAEENEGPQQTANQTQQPTPTPDPHSTYDPLAAQRKRR